MATEKSRTPGADRLRKYIPIAKYDNGRDMSDTVRAAKGLLRKTDDEIMDQRAAAFFDDPRNREEQAELNAAGELADQMKRETRGTKDTSLRGKIREVTGFKAGGLVRRGYGKARGA